MLFQLQWQVPAAVVWHQGSSWEVPRRLTCGRAVALQSPGPSTLPNQLREGEGKDAAMATWKPALRADLGRRQGR